MYIDRYIYIYIQQHDHVADKPGVRQTMCVCVFT